MLYVNSNRLYVPHVNLLKGFTNSFLPSANVSCYWLRGIPLTDFWSVFPLFKQCKSNLVSILSKHIVYVEYILVIKS